MAIDVHSTPRIGYDAARFSPPREARSDALDWFALGRVLWRRKLFLAGFMLLVLGLTAAYVGSIPPTFESESLVKLNDRASQVVDIPEVLAATPVDEQGVQGEVVLITSRAMAERLTDRLNLQLLPEFNPALREEQASLVQWLNPVRWLPAVVLRELPQGWVDALMAADAPVEMSEEQKATLLRNEIVGAVQRAIRAEPTPQSTVISIKFISADPDLAALGANTLADLYLIEQLETKQIASRRAQQFLEQEVQRLRASVAAGEQAIQDYRRQTGLTDPEGEPLDAQQLTGLTTQLVLARGEHAEAEARLQRVAQMIEGDADLAAAAQMLESPVLDALRTREVEIQREMSELSNEFGVRHPRMVSLQTELDQLQARKGQEIRQIAQRQGDEVRVLRARETALESNIARLKDQLSTESEATIQLRALERDTEADRELLNTYNNRWREVASQQKAQEPDARIIARAILPLEPAYPRRPLIFGIALFGSLLVGSLAVFGLEQLDNTLRSSEQIEDLLGLPTLGLVPASNNLGRRVKPEDYVLDNPNSPFGESIRSLRTTMLLSGLAGPPKTLLLTSSVPSEGKSSLVLCLARVHAASGKRTLVIDCDLRRPRLHEMTGARNDAGLADILVAGCELGEVVQTDQRSGAEFVTAGPNVADPAALLASERMMTLLQDAAQRYDLVLLDSPPILSVSDARVLSQMADKTAFLVHWGKTRRQDVMMGVKQLLEAGADMAGLVLSRVDVRKHARYSYRDSGYYYDDKYTKYYNRG